MNRMRRAVRCAPVPHSGVGPSPWGKASQQLAAMFVVTALVVPQHAEARAPDASPLADATQVKERYGRTSEAYDTGNYRAAAESMNEVLKILPENRVNREERETALLVALDAYTREFEKQEATSTRDAVATLKAGVATYDRYVKEFQRVYGGDARVGHEAEYAGTEIEHRYDEARGVPRTCQKFCV